MKLGSPTRIEIKAINGKTRFRFSLTFAASRQPAEFELSAHAAMHLMQALHAVQAFHKLPIPRQPTAKPRLRLVEDDD